MLWIILIIVLLFGLALFVGYYIFNSVFLYKDKHKSDPDPNFLDSEKDLMRPTAKKYFAYREPYIRRMEKMQFKELSIISFDNLTLYGYLLKGNPKEVVICVHGYKSSMEEDFSDRIEIYQKRGSTVLLLNDRAHGKLEGDYLGFSEHDKRDVAR